MFGVMVLGKFSNSCVDFQINAKEHNKFLYEILHVVVKEKSEI
jgi:hypothetical protein